MGNRGEDFNLGLDDDIMEDEDFEVLDNDIDEESFLDEGNKSTKIIDANDPNVRQADSLLRFFEFL